MSNAGQLVTDTGGGGNIKTLSSEGGPHTPPVGNNFNFSGSITGGSAANGAIEFITPGGPGAATAGQMDAVVRTDNVTIQINASNDLEVIGGVFTETIAGDIGSITGSNLTIYANNVLNNSGSSVLFDNAGTVSTLNLSDANFNTFLGQTAGNTALTTAVANTGIGYSCFSQIDTGGNNTALGYGALTSLRDGDTNVAIGVNSLNALSTTDNNTALGYGSLVQLMTGAHNVALGSISGNQYSGSESSNIVIGNGGTVLDNNTIRIGSQGAAPGQQNKAFLAGVVGVTVANEQFVTINSATTQLGIRTSAGVGETITGDTGGALPPTAGNWDIIANVTAKNCGQSVLFSGSGSTLTLNVSDAALNTYVGIDAGAIFAAAGQCCGFGETALKANTNGLYNNAFGSACLTACNSNVNNGFGRGTLQALVSGIENCGFGHAVMGVTESSGNSAFGYTALFVHTGPNGKNCAFGHQSLVSLTNGQFNIALGVDSGINYTGTESSNIVIGSDGVLGESNAIHIGEQGAGTGQQNTCFIAGINGNTVSNAQLVTIDSSTGQLGVTTADAIMWNVVSTNQVGATNNGYIFVSAGGALTISLPTTSAVGDTFEVALDGATSWQITQAAGQQIRLSSSTTTLGAAGTLTSTAQGDALRLVCRTANTLWTALSVIGNITVA